MKSPSDCESPNPNIAWYTNLARNEVGREIAATDAVPREWRGTYVQENAR